MQPEQGATRYGDVTIGLDLAKNVFQVHGIRAIGDVVIRKALRRSQMLPFFERLPPCLVGAEACGTSHRWARELTKLGHEVRLMPAAYVKPYVKRGKNDAADAEAICEAVTRQTMRFVPIKSREQQAALSLHRVRSLLIKQRTQLVNMMRSVLAALGIAIPVGIVKALQMARKIVDGESELELPAEAAHVASVLAGQLLQLHVQLRKLDLLAQPIWQITGNVNGTGASLKGLEVALQLPFSFLPGLLSNFGVEANAAVVDSSTTYRLTGAATSAGTRTTPTSPCALVGVPANYAATPYNLSKRAYNATL
jgi:hypothetical protein